MYVDTGAPVEIQLAVQSNRKHNIAFILPISTCQQFSLAYASFVSVFENEFR